jgi:CheY-like chemotaxis protein
VARILVVEDEADIAMLLEDDLASEGHVIEVVRDSEPPAGGAARARLGRDCSGLMLPGRTAACAVTCGARACARPSSS